MGKKLPSLEPGKCLDKELSDGSRLILGRQGDGIESPEHGITAFRLMLESAIFGGIYAENIPRKTLKKLWNGGIEGREDFFRLSEEEKMRIKSHLPLVKNP